MTSTTSTTCKNEKAPIIVLEKERVRRDARRRALLRVKRDLLSALSEARGCSDGERIRKLLAEAIADADCRIEKLRRKDITRGKGTASK